ncbi:Ldh family oxidoreductase [Agrobacterium larrymoorei]|uniref:Ldh family oxidoreductase n=1 Tax=Agrobacterium larrymoorei TaxID=160699 RepID=UPI001572E5D5|nr:Ldh family oxidoreductase [Agrobacterium larrymoorei]NTJ44762.1 Ldh family oxidoreductase [Agrobacterium larrymoorei]
MLETEARVNVPLSFLDRFCRAVFASAGANTATADAATRAMMHGTRYGVDSHGVRLLAHYVKALTGGRLNRAPNIKKVAEFGAVETLDADNAHGALAAYTAMDHAMQLASSFGIGAVAIQNTSHFGPAGAYSLEAARRGYIGLTFCNSDSFVRLHDGAMRFHGTNPIAVGVPTPAGEAWLLDMATSSIPYNRVLLYRSLGLALPHSTASDARGEDTQDAGNTDMLAPLGGEFGFKGAALAGVVEIFSAVLTGMKLSFDILPMGGPDFSTPRSMGAFVLAIKPEAFVNEATFAAGMQRYLHELRNSPAKEDCKVMAPGDREWIVASDRERDGVMLDPSTAAEFEKLSDTYALTLPFPK